MSGVLSGLEDGEWQVESDASGGADDCGREGRGGGQVYGEKFTTTVQ